MESSSNNYELDLEDSILRIVGKTKNSRNRPCFLNIHASLERGGKQIDIVELKLFIENLVSNNILKNNGIIGKESFALVDETGETHCEDNRDVNLTPQNSVHDYIDEKFHETLIKLIKKEVTSCVKTELHESNLLNKTAIDIYFNESHYVLTKRG